MNTLAKVEPQQLATVDSGSPFLSILQRMSEANITTESVAVMERMMGMYREERAETAKQSFSQDLKRLQRGMGSVTAKKEVLNRDGTLRYVYAPYEEIMKRARPYLDEFGFAVTFDTEISDGRMTVICTLHHGSGHTASSRFAARFSGPPGCTETQADGSTQSYAKRFALCNALNIVIDHDDDARAVGDTITQAEADELRERVKGIAGDEAKFRKFAGAESFETIPRNKLAELRAMLDRKEEAKRKEYVPANSTDPEVKF